MLAVLVSVARLIDTDKLSEIVLPKCNQIAHPAKIFQLLCKHTSVAAVDN